MQGVYIFSVLFLFALKVLAENHNVTESKETLYTVEFPGSLDNDTELIEIDFADNARDKRALGILLQGLVQALGYNTTPIQIASLPNSGMMQLGPITLDLRNSRVVNSTPNPSPTMATAANTPGQRETLRFTGVVNFGNGTNIADHLRRYERLFHGNGSTTPPPPPPAPSAAPGTPSPLPLLQPFFVPIPIPLAENLRYPKPLLSVVTTQSSVVAPTPVDLDQRAPAPAPKPSPTPRPESGESDRSNSAEGEEKNRSENDYQKNESQELDDGKEESEETKGNQVDDNETSKEIMDKLKESLGSPEEYVSKIPKFSKGFGIKLPIEIKPFRGQLMNSYGQSLEHDGKIDENVADFFAKYKNPKTGVFEPLKIEVPEDDSIEKLPQKYLNMQSKYEEYDLKDEGGGDEIQNVSKEELKEDNYEDDEEDLDANEEDEEGEEEGDEEEEEEENAAAEMLKKMENQDSSRQSQQNLQNVPQFNQNLANRPVNDPRLQNVPFGGQPYDNFGHLNPYYKPVQYFYSPDSLERTAQRVSSFQNVNDFPSTNQGFPPSGESFIRGSPDFNLGPRIAKRIAARQQNIAPHYLEKPVTTTSDGRKDQRREEPVVRTTSQATRKLEEKITVSKTSSPVKRRDNSASASSVSTTHRSTSTPISTSSNSGSVPSTSREEMTTRRPDRRRSNAPSSRNRNSRIVNESRGQVSAPENVKRNVNSTRSIRDRSRN